MDKKSKALFNDIVGCFGDFCMEDPICKNFCALRLRCAIEYDHNSQMEIWEDMVSQESLSLRIN